MKPLTAVILILAGLAGGTGIRLAVERAGDGPGTPARNTARKGPAESPIPTGAKTPAGPRPEASVVVAARGASRLRLLMAWLPGADAGELMEMAGVLADPNASENLGIRLLMARWAEVDPAAMMRWTETLQHRDEEFSQESLIASAIEAWARVDFEKAWTAAASRPDTRVSALLGLTAVDPARCLELLRRDPSLLDLRGFADPQAILKRLATRDAAGTAAFVAGLDARRLARCSGVVAAAWVKTDPMATAAWMATLPRTSYTPEFDETIRQIAATAPAAWEQLAASLPPGQSRAVGEAAAFRRLVSADPDEARRRIEAMPDGPSRQFSRGLLMAALLRKGDEAGALALASQIGWMVKSEWEPGTQITVTGSGTDTTRRIDSERGEIDNACATLMAKLAASNPSEAARAVAAMSDDSDWISVLSKMPPDNFGPLASALLQSGDTAWGGNDTGRRVISEWANRDPAAAGSWISSNLPPGDDRDTAVNSLLIAWDDPPAMLRWAASDGEKSEQAAWKRILDAGNAYPGLHPEELAAAAGRHEELAQAIRADHFSAEASARILMALPENAAVDVAGLTGNWVGRDPEAAGAWVRDLPPGDRRSDAITGMAGQLCQSEDFVSAFSWAGALPADRRSDVMRGCVSSWAAVDPAAAREAVSASQLPDEEKSGLLKLLPP